MTQPDKWDEIAENLRDNQDELMPWKTLDGIATALRSAYAEGEKAGMERAERKSDAMQQLAYANGLKAGWNMAEAGESIAHPERVAALVQEAMTELSAIRAAKETKNPPPSS